MVIYLGADHRGFRLKETLKSWLSGQGYEVVDCGNTIEDGADDFVDYARAVGERVAHDSENGRGVVICGSGVGVDIAANKVSKVRSVLGFANDQVLAARHDSDANVLSIASDFTKEDQVKEFITIFLQTPFGAAERYLRRLNKIADIEHG